MIPTVTIPTVCVNCAKEQEVISVRAAVPNPTTTTQARSGEHPKGTRKSSCVSARGIPTAAYQVLHMLPYPGEGVPWLGGTYPGWGVYLPWQGGTYLGREYLPWPGVPILAGGTYLAWGVPTLAGGCTYLGRGYLPWLGVPILAGSNPPPPQVWTD